MLLHQNLPRDRIEDSDVAALVADIVVVACAVLLDASGGYGVFVAGVRDEGEAGETVETVGEGRGVQLYRDNLDVAELVVGDDEEVAAFLRGLGLWGGG